MQDLYFMSFIQSVEVLALIDTFSNAWRLKHLGGLSGGFI